jgi:hypothetical protein
VFLVLLCKSWILHRLVSNIRRIMRYDLDTLVASLETHSWSRSDLQNVFLIIRQETTTANIFICYYKSIFGTRSWSNFDYFPLITQNTKHYQAWHSNTCKAPQGRPNVKIRRFFVKSTRLVKRVIIFRHFNLILPFCALSSYRHVESKIMPLRLI